MASFVSRKVEQARRRAEVARALLAQHNQSYEGRPSRKLECDQILEKLPNITKLKDFWIRKPEEWESKSFNEERQIIDFISWLLCKYPVPLFMYKVFNNGYKKNGYVRGASSALDEIYLDWFVTIGQGMSFRKASKDFLSKKEAPLFLDAPRENSISGNILWAKCKAHNVSQGVINNMCNYWHNRYSNSNKNIWSEILTFYARYPEITGATVHDTMDFIYSNIGKNFTLAGRTLNSVIQLTNEWHADLQMKSSSSSSWQGLPIPPWKLEIDDHMDVWYITQITTAKDLFREGKSMKHCVGSYVQQCKSGGSGIFSMAHDYYGGKSKCLTIEVSKNNEIVQAKGPCNRGPTAEERNILKKWAMHNNLTYNRYMYL